MCVCLYNKLTDTLILAFEGKDSLTGTLRKKAIEKLPEYMQNILNQGGLIASLNKEEK